MTKQKIKEMIVVEGKHDSSTLRAYFDCDTIETGGDQLSAQTLERIKKAQQERGVIVFTDPDSPGEHIRRQIKAAVPQAKHAFIPKEKARTTKKVGVEHARKEDLWRALEQRVTFIKHNESLAWSDFIDFGFVGNKALRHGVCERLGIGPCNAKTCFRRLNEMNVTKEDLLEILEEKL
ncbi:ribonuclease M5 [uncultured Dubosiella sp.]|uniref:ribonuclease M5 n=1 Tax=uncultured Dubosiella sp. TaxID=1937011 RepID=UPI00259878CA|nr:ribonuclease M5 [uncultured Dubosiella sp.]